MLIMNKKVRFRIHIHPMYRNEVKEAIDNLFIYYKESCRTDEIIEKEVDTIIFECEAPEEEFNEFVKQAEKFDFTVRVFYY